jgi:hypothetical protein
MEHQEQIIVDERNCCSFICCMVFKLLVLLGFGLVLLGLIFMVCPYGLCNKDALEHFGLVLKVWGILLMLIGFVFWLVLCRPKPCDWLAFLWQCFILAGLMLIYAGLCPECEKLLYTGAAVFVVGWLLFFYWMRMRYCGVKACKWLSELAGLFLIPVNVLLGLEVMLLTCATQSRTAPIIIYIFVFLIEAWLLVMLKRNRCLNC